MMVVEEELGEIRFSGSTPFSLKDSGCGRTEIRFDERIGEIYSVTFDTEEVDSVTQYSLLLKKRVVYGKTEIRFGEKLREIYYLATPDTTQADPVTGCSIFFKR
ncbi:hypothetical protein K0M31_005389 [Melipona bicolor]|uniref:Uncharacterized protein n=1 Tax=Melipona bicolor TaxID=60889 RepID=A0AA40KMD5_9HYME|nr:hypothetical protein K0M31_005389 [Melipona bicolor]